MAGEVLRKEQRDLIRKSVNQKDWSLTLLFDTCDHWQLRAEAAEREVEQLRLQLAGCSVAALGGTKDPATQGQYGWSPAYADVLHLRMMYEAHIAADAKEQT